MAKRNVYYYDDEFYRRESVEFNWYSGFSKSQKQKSIESLHDQFRKKNKQYKILEVSSASLMECGRKASAFNLSLKLKNGETYSVETLFQSSKVFDRSGVNSKTLHMNSRDAKRFTRNLHSEEELIAFDFLGIPFPLLPETFFYNWLYANAMLLDVELLSEILKYNAFTDINSNPQKSLNCQAEACSIICYLNRIGRLNEEIRSPKNFFELVYPDYRYVFTDDIVEEEVQLSLFDL